MSTVNSLAGILIALLLQAFLHGAYVVGYVDQRFMSHNRPNRKSRCGARLRTYVGNIYLCQAPALTSMDSPHERKIVECKTSCYVLGRSGTGYGGSNTCMNESDSPPSKTTTMLFKMLGIERAWEMNVSGSDMLKPRQIFVTKSSVLAIKVDEYFAKLRESLELARYSLEDLKRMKARSAEFRLVDADDTDRVDIPQKYSELEEKHFPLFVTFDKVIFTLSGCFNRLLPCSSLRT